MKTIGLKALSLKLIIAYAAIIVHFYKIIIPFTLWKVVTYS